MNSRAQGVQRKLADRNSHAADTEVTQPENSLAIRNYDDFNVLSGGALSSSADISSRYG